MGEHAPRSATGQAGTVLRGRVAVERTASRAWVAVEFARPSDAGPDVDAAVARLYGPPDRVLVDGGRRRYLYDLDAALLPPGSGLGDDPP